SIVGTFHFVTYSTTNALALRGGFFLTLSLQNLKKRDMKNQSKKEVSLKFRVTELEKEIIENRAKINEKTLSDYARFMLIKGEIIVISDKEKSILGGLGNDINQLTKRFHQREEVPAELLNELKTTLIQLKNAYRRSS